MSFSPFSLLASPAVLSDDKRRALYDAGMYDPLDDDDDQEDVEVKQLGDLLAGLSALFRMIYMLMLFMCAVMVSGIPRLRAGDGLAHGQRGNYQQLPTYLPHVHANQGAKCRALLQQSMIN
jgi:hypothetical protein